jgi:DNA-binding CsgD family transcriptional regulator
MDRKGLTTSEARVLYWLANGLTRNELAVEYGISVGTIRLHLARASRKLGTRTVLHTIAVAYRLGLI